jgi:hypothetical protein
VKRFLFHKSSGQRLEIFATHHYYCQTQCLAQSYATEICTMFTQMQDNSHLINTPLPPPTQKKLPRENVFNQIYNYPTKNKMSAKRKYFTINFTHLIRKGCQILSSSSNQWHHLHLHNQCFHLSHTSAYHSDPLHCHSTTYHHQSHPLHWLHRTSYNPSFSLLVRCVAMLLWSTLTKYYIYISWFINLFEPMTISNFLHRWC